MDTVHSTQPIFKFEVHKSSNLGLLIPSDLQLYLYQVLPLVQNSIPSYITNKMDWTDVLTALPPEIELAVPIGPDSVKGGKLAPLVSAMPRGIQGYTSFTIDMEALPAPDPIAFEKRLPTSVPQKWAIKHSGLKRSYRLDPANKSKDGNSLVWKGSTQVLGTVDDGTPKCHGNMKLETKDGKHLVAAWKQRRDSEILGSISIFEHAEDCMSIEQIITSCLCIVMWERITGVSLVGGLGKR